MDFAVLYQTHPKLFLWWRVSVWSVLRCVCPKAVEFSLVRGIVTFHEHVSSAQLVKKSEIEDGVIEADATRPKPPSSFIPSLLQSCFTNWTPGTGHSWIECEFVARNPSPPIFSSFYRTQDFLTSCWHPFILVGEKHLKCLVHYPLSTFSTDCVLPPYSRVMCCLNSYGTTLLLVRISVTTLTSATLE